MKKRRGIGISLGIIAILIATGSLLCLALPGWLERTAQRYCNETLSALLGVETSVESVEVDVSRGRVVLYDFRAGQPEGFGDKLFVHLPELEVRISLRSLLSRTLEVEYVALTRAEIHIHRGTNGVSNAQFLADGLRSRHGDPDRKSRHSVHMALLTATECKVFYFEPPDSLPIEFVVADLAVQLSNVRISSNPSEAGEEPGRLCATGRLQKPPFPDGRCGLVAKIGPIGPVPPAVNCAVRLIGIELAVVAPDLPGEATALLGGSAVDVFVDFRGDADFLSGRAVLETIARYRHEAIISGTLRKPAIRIDDRVMAFMFTRGRGALGNLLSSGAAAGKEAFGRAAGVTEGLAESASKTAGSFGQSLRETVKGVTALNPSGIWSGVKEIGAALGGGARDAFVEAGEGVRRGAGEIRDQMSKDERSRKWREEVPQRWDRDWPDALNTIERSAFPPSGEVSAPPPEHGTAPEHNKRKLESAS
jgi:hypothetical protein